MIYFDIFCAVFSSIWSYSVFTFYSHRLPCSGTESWIYFPHPSCDNRKIRYLKSDSDRATRLRAITCELNCRVVSELPCNSILVSRKTLDLFNIWQLVATGVAVSEQTGNVTRPSLAVLTNQKHSFDDSLDSVTSQAHCDVPRYKIHCCNLAGSPGWPQMIVSVGRHNYDVTAIMSKKSARIAPA